MTKAEASLAAALIAVATLAMPVTAVVPVAPPATKQIQAPPDAWPRPLALPGASVLVYAPQVTGWADNRISFRSAAAIKPDGAARETFGVLNVTANTRVDRVSRTVTLDGLVIVKSDFPTLPDRGAQYAAQLQQKLASVSRTMTLDRLQASLSAAGIVPAAVAVDNTPPRVIVSNSPSILVPIDGTPVWQPAPGAPGFERVINTRALIVRSKSEPQVFMRVYDGWMMANTLDGPWTQPFIPPTGIDAVAKQAAATGVVDLLDGGPRANPKPSLAQGLPAIFTSQVPAELIVFKGAPEFVPIVGTGLLWAANTSGDMLRAGANGDYFVLLAGRWFRSGALTGPWTYVAANALPADFARIPPGSLAGAVLPAVAGTPQAREALVENAIPQTATVPLKNGPTFVAKYDGAPQFAPIPGTALSYAVNARVPVIRSSGNVFHALRAGIWFTAAQPTGPWTVATSVPPAIYTIPPTSPMFNVTFARVYGATPDAVYMGYTPGYLGAIASTDGTVVFGTGYRYPSWTGTAWYPGRPTYGHGATPVYNPRVGYTYAFAVGLATVAWSPPGAQGAPSARLHPSYWGGYPCCGTASANVYRAWAKDAQAKVGGKRAKGTAGTANAAPGKGAPAAPTAAAVAPAAAANVPGSAAAPPETRIALNAAPLPPPMAPSQYDAYAPPRTAWLRHVDGDRAGHACGVASGAEGRADAGDFRQRVLREPQGQRWLRPRLGGQHDVRGQQRQRVPQRGQRVAAARQRRLAERTGRAAGSERGSTGALARRRGGGAGGLLRHEQRHTLLRRSQRRLVGARFRRWRVQPHAGRRWRHQRAALRVQHGRAQQRVRHRRQRRLVGNGRLRRRHRVGWGVWGLTAPSPFALLAPGLETEGRQHERLRAAGPRSCGSCTKRAVHERAVRAVR